jgi:hypothetical protein
MAIGYHKPLYVLPFDHRATTAAQIAGSYREWVDLSEKAK